MILVYCVMNWNDKKLYVYKALKNWDGFDAYVHDAIFSILRRYDNDKTILSMLKTLPGTAISFDIDLEYNDYGGDKNPNEAFINVCIQIIATLALLKMTHLIIMLPTVRLAVDNNVLDVMYMYEHPNKFKNIAADPYTLRYLFRYKYTVKMKVGSINTTLGHLVDSAFAKEDEEEDFDEDI